MAVSKLVRVFKNKDTSVHTIGKYFSHTVNNVVKIHDSWILDTGATNHIVCSLGYFDEYTHVTSLTMNMPNGGVANVAYTGNIKVDNDIILEDVLYIPSFCFNIVPASRLTKDSSCCLYVLFNCCLIQERNNVMKSGFSKEKGGMYYLINPPQKKSCLLSTMNHHTFCSVVSLNT